MLWSDEYILYDSSEQSPYLHRPDFPSYVICIVRTSHLMFSASSGLPILCYLHRPDFPSYVICIVRTSHLASSGLPILCLFKIVFAKGGSSILGMCFIVVSIPTDLLSYAGDLSGLRISIGRHPFNTTLDVFFA